MAAELKWHGDRAKGELDLAVGLGLLRAAVFLQTQHRLKLNVSNPAPYLNSSKPGEYPRARTGFGRDSTMYEPTTASAIAKTQSVKFGYFANAWYMPYLEVFKKRLGLVKTVETFGPQAAELAAAEVRQSQGG